jgi:hypothetical protein
MAGKKVVNFRKILSRLAVLFCSWSVTGTGTFSFSSMINESSMSAFRKKKKVVNI